MTDLLHRRGAGSMAAALTATALLTSVSVPAAQAAGVTITSYGHSALLIRGGGRSVLVNPFKAVGCAGLREPRVNATVTLASSELPDEGARVGGGTYLVKPGSYRVGGLNLEASQPPTTVSEAGASAMHALALATGWAELRPPRRNRGPLERRRQSASWSP